jgi:hypothetical protein
MGGVWNHLTPANSSSTCHVALNGAKSEVICFSALERIDWQVERQHPGSQKFGACAAIHGAFESFKCMLPTTTAF